VKIRTMRMLEHAAMMSFAATLCLTTRDIRATAAASGIEYFLHMILRGCEVAWSSQDRWRSNRRPSTTTTQTTRMNKSRPIVEFGSMSNMRVSQQLQGFYRVCDATRYRKLCCTTVQWPLRAFF
jgi:hypothetical protein